MPSGGMSEEYNDLSWLESELDQRDNRLGDTNRLGAPGGSLGGGGMRAAPAFALAPRGGMASLPGGTVQGMAGASLAPGAQGMKRKQAAAGGPPPRRRAKATAAPQGEGEMGSLQPVPPGGGSGAANPTAEIDGELLGDDLGAGEDTSLLGALNDQPDEPGEGPVVGDGGEGSSVGMVVDAAGAAGGPGVEPAVDSPMPLAAEASDGVAPGMHLAIGGGSSGVDPPDRSNSSPPVTAVVIGGIEDGRCDVELLDPETHRPTGERSRVAVSDCAIACSACKRETLLFEPPLLRCSGCDRKVRSGSSYYAEPRAGVRICTACFDALRTADERPAMLPDEVELRCGSLERRVWEAKEEVEQDHYVQCDRCQRWYHYICAAFPDPAQLPPEWGLDSQTLCCSACVASADPARAAQLLRQPGSSLLRALQRRSASDLPSCATSDAVEAHVAVEIAAAGVQASGLVVRVVSQRLYHCRAVAGMKVRYGADYPDSFPYRSKALFAFQEVDGADVCVFALYVQEYDAACPRPNTNRTYISYLDSTRWLHTSPPGQRSVVYHAIVNGYLQYAGAAGFSHAHLWVEPPKAGDEYIFYCRRPDPAHGSRPMPTSQLRAWYVRMLERAQATGIVAEFGDIQQELVSGLTSLRDFPLFEGDFFPEHVAELVDESSGGAEPHFSRKQSITLVEDMKAQVAGVKRRFLVARLSGAAPTAPARGTDGGHEQPVRSNELVDSRQAFLAACKARHWQFSDLPRARYSTMMLLALLGGRPVPPPQSAS
uniref:histone acetyltransferase n=1 Tax=Emiliania huxleyi TaxID=2903 RepID=A0A7S3TMM3_EMIHU